jgi:predicted GNAT family N-acyltransferase
MRARPGLDTHVVRVQWEDRAAALRDIRQRVFVEEQKIPKSLEFDDLDLTAIHLLALNSAGQTLGCARITKTGQIGRMAVVSEHRRCGVGRLLLDAAIEAAMQAHLTRVHLHAQMRSAAFYHKQGFRQFGPVFTEAGIEHLAMELALPIPFESLAAEQQSTRQNASSRAPDPAEGTAPERVLLEFSDETDARLQLHQLVETGRRTLRIYSQHLDHALFDPVEFVDRVSGFVRSSASAIAQILISDSKLIVSRGHLLIELSRRLEDKIQVRCLPDSLKGDKQSWMIVDNNALWVQSETDSYRGWSDTYNLVQAERFTRRFTHFWDRSTKNPELRRLQL